MRRTRPDLPAPGAPFLFVPSADAGWLLGPFPNRRTGPTAGEIARFEAVAERLEVFPDGVAWIDARTGAVTPATIRPPQLQRRILDQMAMKIRPH